MRLSILAIIYLLCAAIASADDVDAAIRSYNAAKSGGDFQSRMETATALGTVAMSADHRSDATLLVFEAAQTLTLNGRYSQALGMVDWMAEQPPVTDTVLRQIDIELLSVYTKWLDSKSNKSRKSFDKVLQKFANADPSLLSLAAFQSRHAHDIEKGRWSAAAVTAHATADHLEPAKSIVGEIWSNAKLNALSAQFNHQRKVETLLEVAKHEAELKMMHRSMHAQEGEHPGWITGQLHRTEAWRLAMTAYFYSSSHRIESKRERLSGQINEVLTLPPSEIEITHAKAATATEKMSLPFCRGSFDMRPALSYPSGAAEKGMYGAIIMSIDVKNGKVSKAKALAAVPSDGFIESAQETIQKWTWKVSDEFRDEIGTTCGLDGEDIRLPLTFEMQ